MRDLNEGTVFTHYFKSILMKTIKAEFIHSIQKKQTETGNADRQAGNIDKGQCLLPCQVANSDLEIVLDHDYTLIVRCMILNR